MARDWDIRPKAYDPCGKCGRPISPGRPAEVAARLCDRCLASPPSDAEMLARIRSLAEAKPFRAAMLHYAGARNGQGAGAASTTDAELNAYRQALALVIAMLGKGIA